MLVKITYILFCWKFPLKASRGLYVRVQPEHSAESCIIQYSTPCFVGQFWIFGYYVVNSDSALCDIEHGVAEKRFSHRIYILSSLRCVI